MTIINPTDHEQRFIDAYFEAVYFTETGDTDQPDSDAKLDEDFERESVIDCLVFFNRYYAWLSDDEIEQAGHDFWLTRNGHGTGFWDGEYANEWNRDQMDAFALAFGGVDAYFEESND